MNPGSLPPYPRPTPRDWDERPPRMTARNVGYGMVGLAFLGLLIWFLIAIRIGDWIWLFMHFFFLDE